MAVGQHERLAGSVTGLSRNGLEGGGGCHVEDRDVSTFDHAGEQCRTEVNHRLDVGPDHGQFPGYVAVLYSSHGGEPGVVHQQVDHQVPGCEFGDDVGA